MTGWDIRQAAKGMNPKKGKGVDKICFYVDDYLLVCDTYKEAVEQSMKKGILGLPNRLQTAAKEWAQRRVVFLSNLSYAAAPEHVAYALAAYGPIEGGVHLFTDKATGRPKGQATATFATVSTTFASRLRRITLASAASVGDGGGAASSSYTIVVAPGECVVIEGLFCWSRGGDRVSTGKFVEP